MTHSVERSNQHFEEAFGPCDSLDPAVLQPGQFESFERLTVSAPSVPTSYRVVRLALLGCPVVGKEPHLLVMMLRCLVAVSTGSHRWLLVTSEGDQACLRRQRRLSRTKCTRRVRIEEELGRYLHWWDDTFPDASRQLCRPYGMSIVQALLGWLLRMNDTHEIEKAKIVCNCLAKLVKCNSTGMLLLLLRY